MRTPPKVVAIAVTYHPDLKAIKDLIAATSTQVDSVVLVDNTPQPTADLKSHFQGSDWLHFISLGENMGIAYAHNIGIEWAYDQDADYVLLLDQDSVPSPSMVQNLLASLHSNNSIKLVAAAAGPTYEDPRTGVRSYFMVTRYGIPCQYKPIKNKPNIGLLLVNFLISSGSLIPMQSLITLGGMRSNYFIDHVDTEWCLRARAKGFSLLGNRQTIMEHSLGDNVKRIWLLYMRSVAYHSPLRDYYMFRNTLLLLQDVKMSFVFRVFLLVRLFQFASYFLIFAKDRGQRLRCMSLGLYHGFKYISGKFDLKTGFCTPIPSTKFDPK